VSTIGAESLDAGHDAPAAFAQWLSSVAHSYRFGDGVEVLGWLLDLAGGADRDPAPSRSTRRTPRFGGQANATIFELL